MSATARKKTRRVVDESLLAAMMTDPRVQTMFPMFRQAAQGVRARRTCCESRFSHHTVDLRALKERVRNMPPDALARLKGLLGVDALVFYSQGPNGLATVEK